MKIQVFASLIIAAIILPGSLFAGGAAEQAPDKEATRQVSNDGSPEEPTPVDGESNVSSGTGLDAPFLREQLRPLGMRVMERDIEAPSFTAQSLGGEELTLSELQGNLVFLNFWATWCGPCREEMPSMENLKSETAGRPFQIVGVNVQEPRDTVQRFVDDFGYTFPIALDPQGSVAAQYGIRGIPTTFLVGPDGNVLGYLIGTRYWDDPEVLQAIDAMLSHIESISG